METHSNEAPDTLASIYDAIRAHPASQEVDSLVKTLI